MREKFALFFLLFTVSVFSQNFEGEIVYKNSCISNKPEWKMDYCQMITDSIERFFYKNRDYKYSVPNNKTWTIFKRYEKKIYKKTKKPGKIFWSNVNSNTDSIKKITINKKVLKVLGYKCDELIIEFLGGIQKYYFNSKLSIDSKYYENYNGGSFYSIASITKSIPLKTVFIIEEQGLILESIAIKITKKVLNNELFIIPSDVQLVEGKF